MGKLWVISVKGAVPHSACYLEYEGSQWANGWLGFAPAAHRRPAGRGKIYTDDESYRVNHGIILQVGDAALAAAADEVTTDYEDAFYVLGVQDCVSFSAELVRQCGLLVPDVNFTPFGLILILAVWNPYEKRW
jgi:hypothetical protein